MAVMLAGHPVTAAVGRPFSGQQDSGAPAPDSPHPAPAGCWANLHAWSPPSTEPSAGLNPADFFAEGGVLAARKPSFARLSPLLKDQLAHAVDLEGEQPVLLPQHFYRASELSDLLVSRIGSGHHVPMFVFVLLEALVDLRERPLSARQFPDEGVDVDSRLPRQRRLAPFWNSGPTVTV